MNLSLPRIIHLFKLRDSQCFIHHLNWEQVTTKTKILRAWDVKTSIRVKTKAKAGLAQGNKNAVDSDTRSSKSGLTTKTGLKYHNTIRCCRPKCSHRVTELDFSLFSLIVNCNFWLLCVFHWPQPCPHFLHHFYQIYLPPRLLFSITLIQHWWKLYDSIMQGN